ncbi:MAG: hypothetical protein JWP08_2943 [Bryobacterales bacterium]|nr:hypothetical protein [Bryobacterales bacterium]
MPGVACRKCAKRSGWLVAIPFLAFVPKCPVCLLAYLAVPVTALWSHSGVVLGVVMLVLLSVICSTWCYQPWRAMVLARNEAKLCQTDVIPIGTAKAPMTKVRGAAHIVDRWMRCSEKRS